jgi:hypothetical protein
MEGALESRRQVLAYAFSRGTDAYTMGTCSFSGWEKAENETAIACNGSNAVLWVAGRLEHGFVTWNMSDARRMRSGRLQELESDQQIADSRNGYQDVFPLPSCVLQVRQCWPLRRGLLQQ